MRQIYKSNIVTIQSFYAKYEDGYLMVWIDGEMRIDFTEKVLNLLILNYLEKNLQRSLHEI